MKRIIERRGVRQFIKFCIVGVSSTIVDWGVFYLLDAVFGIYYVYAKVISFLVAVINSFFWNRSWTFRSRSEQRMHEFIKYMLVYTIGMGLNVGIMYSAVDHFHWRKLAGLIAATAITSVWNFLTNKFWTFRQSQQPVER